MQDREETRFHRRDEEKEERERERERERDETSLNGWRWKSSPPRKLNQYLATWGGRVSKRRKKRLRKATHGLKWPCGISEIDVCLDSDLYASKENECGTKSGGRLMGCNCQPQPQGEN